MVLAPGHFEALDLLIEDPLTITADMDGFGWRRKDLLRPTTRDGDAV